MRRIFLSVFFLFGIIATQKTLAQAPVANFGVITVSTFVKDTFCSGTTVAFQDSSNNSPSSWAWNFNFTSNANIIATPNGGSSTVSQNPTVLYKNTSTLVQQVNITLIATNGSGGSIAFSKTIFIYPAKPLAPVMNFSPSIVCKDSSILFSIGATTSFVKQYTWNFGANSSPSFSNSSSPISVAFSVLNASQNITLTATNACGSTTTANTISIVGPPTANFISPSVGGAVCNHLPITFTDGSVGGATAWLWNFGNGHTSTLQNPVDSYLIAGTYTVTLIAYNSCGASQSYSSTIKIKNCSPPVAFFKTDTDTVCMNTPVIFYDLSQNGLNTNFWTAPNSTPSGKNTANDTVVFNSAGTVTVTLLVKNSYGQSSYSKVITILRCLPPIAAFNSQLTVCQGRCNTLANHSTDTAEAHFTKVRWYFKGSRIDSSMTYVPPTVCYDSVGTHNIELIVCNIYGCDTLIQPITVLPAPRIYSTDTCVYAGYSINLKAHGNGKITWIPNIELNTSTGDSVIATPSNQQTYTVRDTTTCPSPDSVTICIHYRNAIISSPNTFTPGTTGSANSIFKINANIPVNEFNMKIYNRWGEMVYNSNDYLGGWDGTFNGVQQNSGVYVYIIGYRDLGDNQYKFINGNVTLIR